MSSIDERVVEMRFKDSDFKAGIKRTLDSLGQLKSSLQMKGATTGLENVKTAASKFSLEGMAQSIEGIKEKFSSMSVVGIASLATLASKAVDVGLQMSRGLVKPMTDGFAEYELKLGSIQTIMAGTGAPLDVVNQKLSELNEYADKTIYSFADMTSNIGKFTNAGVDLDTSVAAIQGVANVAAISGASSEEASRAMYNFSQALSIGYVGLMDWKSIELANMGTAEFRQQLIDSAVAMGTLKKQSDGVWTTLDGTEVTVKNFRNTLNDQWLTAEALTETLGRYSDTNTDIGKRATAAATEVKTFSHLLDTLAESAGSGWAESFEIVVGNFDEAKALWTGVNAEIGGILEAQADARNKMLQDWKDAGGRDDLRQGISNLWNSLMTVINTVKGAFRDIFPPSTTNILSLITSGFLKLSEIIKMGADRFSNLEPVFKTIFGILKAGVSVVSGIVRYFADFAIIIGGGLLGSLIAILGAIGALINRFIDWVKASEGIQDFFDMLIRMRNGVLKPLADAIENVVKAIEMFASGNNASGMMFLRKAGEKFEVVLDRIQGYLGDIFGVLGDLGTRGADFLRGLGIKALEPFAEGLDWIVEKFNEFKSAIQEKLSLPDLGNYMEKWEAARGGASRYAGNTGGFFSGISDAFQSFKDTAAPIIEEVTDFIGTIIGKIKSYIESLDAREMIALVNTGFFILAYRSFKKFSDAFIDLAYSAGEALDELGETLKTFQQQAKANIILTIAIALGILAAAVYVLAQVDVGNMIKALVAIGVMMAMLMVALKVFQKYELGDQSGMFKTAAALILLAVAIKIMSSAVKDLAGMDWEELAKGLIGIGVLLAGVTLFSKYANADKSSMSAGAGLILLGVALKILVGVVEDLGTMDMDTLRQGLLTLGLLLAGLGVMVKVMNGTTGAVNAALGLLILAAALVALEFVLKRYAAFDLGELANGLGKVALVLVAVGLAMQAFPQSMVAKAAGLVILAGALVLLSGVINLLGQMDLGDLAKGVGALVVSLAAIAIALNVMNGTAAGAAALLLATVAIAGLAAVIFVLAQLDIGQVAIALGAIAGVFLIIGLAAVLLTPVIPVILALGIALGVLATAMLLAGVGFLAFATGFATMAAVGSAGAVVLLGVVEGLLLMIPLLMEQVGLGLIAFARVIADSGPPMVEALTTVFGSILQAIEDTAPQLGETFLALMTTLINVVVELAPDLAEAGAQLILGFLTVLEEYIPQIADKGLELVTGFINAIAENIGPIIEAGANLIVEFLNGLTEELPRIAEAVTQLIITFIEEVGDNMGEIAQAGTDTLEEFLLGISGNLGTIIETVGLVITQFIEDVGTQFERIRETGEDVLVAILEGIGRTLGTIITTVTSVIIRFTEDITRNGWRLLLAGGRMVIKLMEGVSATILWVVRKGFDILISFLEGLEDAIRENTGPNGRLWTAGWGVADAIVDGIVAGFGTAAKNRVVAVAKGIGTAAVTAVRLGAIVFSPSRHTFETAGFIIDGLVMGLEEGRKPVERASSEIGRTSVEAMRKSIKDISKLAMDEMDSNPTIRPVLDLSAVKKDAAALSGLLPSSTSISVERPTNRAYDLLPKIVHPRSRFDVDPIRTTPEPVSPTYIQNNHSPKALSAIEIYRQTNNQLSIMRRN